MHKFGLWLSSEADYLQIVNEVISKPTSRNINTYTRKKTKKKNRSKDQKCLMLITRALKMSFRGEKNKTKTTIGQIL